MAAVKCPVCGVSVKAENLERHLKNQHPHEKVDLSEVLTEEDREAVAETRQSPRAGLTRGGKRMLVIVAIVVAVLVVLIIVYPLLTPLNTQFTLPSTDGTTVSIPSWKGNPVLVEFMDLDCPYCQQEAPLLITLFTSTAYNFTTRGVKFVSVDMNFEETADTATRINNARYTDTTSPFYGSTWPYVIDADGKVARSYGASQTPTIFILDKNGNVYKKHVGYDANAVQVLAGELNALLGG
jgi:thiol-disulfide isomerase/thioredoxin